MNFINNQEHRINLHEFDELIKPIVPLFREFDKALMFEYMDP
jgi:hypothetical protein